MMPEEPSMPDLSPEEVESVLEFIKTHRKSLFAMNWRDHGYGIRLNFASPMPGGCPLGFLISKKLGTLNWDSELQRPSKEEVAEQMDLPPRIAHALIEAGDGDCSFPSIRKALIEACDLKDRDYFRGY